MSVSKQINICDEDSLIRINLEALHTIATMPAPRYLDMGDGATLAVPLSWEPRWGHFTFQRYSFPSGLDAPAVYPMNAAYPCCLNASNTFIDFDSFTMSYTVLNERGYFLSEHNMPRMCPISFLAACQPPSELPLPFRMWLDRCAQTFEEIDRQLGVRDIAHIVMQQYYMSEGERRLYDAISPK